MPRKKPRTETHYSELPPVQKHRRESHKNYSYFPPKEQAHQLGIYRIGQSFNEKTKILEIGAGSGRLAQHLLKNTKLKPENYELFDAEYGDHLPWLKRKIYSLSRQNKLKLTQGDMWNHKFPKNVYSHIFIPNAFFPDVQKDRELYSELIIKAREGKLEKSLAADLIGYKDCLFLQELLNNLLPSLKSNGTIRVSHIDPATTEYAVKNAKHFFPKVKVSLGGSLPVYGAKPHVLIFKKLPFARKPN